MLNFLTYSIFVFIIEIIQNWILFQIIAVNTIQNDSGMKIIISL